MFYDIYKKSNLLYLLNRLDKYKNLSLIELYKLYKSSVSDVSRQFSTIVQNEANRIYGNQILREVINSLQRGECFFAGNCAGFENNSYTIANSILLKSCASILNTGYNLIFTHNAISPKHISMPTSIKLATRDEESLRHFSVNLLSHKYDNYLLNHIDSIDTHKVDEAYAKLSGISHPYEQKAFLKLKDYLLPTTNFIKQSALFNTHLYDNYLEPMQSRNLYIPLEPCAIASLKLDLKNDKSLMSKLIDNKDILLKLINDLSTKKLISHELIDLNNNNNSYKHIKGTILFYSLDEHYKIHPLKLICENEQYYLSNYSYKVKLTRQDLFEALDNNKLIPSIFSIYMPFMLDHNVNLICDIFMPQDILSMLEIVGHYFAKEYKLQQYYLDLVAISALMPISVNTKGDEFNQNHPLSLLDMLILPKLTNLEIELMLVTKIQKLTNYSLTCLALDYLDPIKIYFHKHMLLDNLKQGSTIKISQID